MKKGKTYKKQKKQLSFYNVKTKKKFKTDMYDIRKRGKSFFAVTKAPKFDFECWLIVGKDFAKGCKK